MNFEPTNDQVAILSALSRILDRYRSVDPKDVIKHSIYAAELQAALTDAGFLEVGAADAQARVTSALILAEIARLPVCVEASASLLVRPVIAAEAPAPVALMFGDLAMPTRFLPQARSALLINNHGIRLLPLEPGDVDEVSSLFAYPMGRLKPTAATRASILSSACKARVHQAWRIGIALEIYGALHAATALTIEHVKQRRQFGRPLGSFQAIQHRLAMNATTIEAIRWLALKAAYSATSADAALAAAYAQSAVSAITYDLHQFSGAMGLTLEYPLHLYTYRARMLQSDLGGSRAQVEEAVAATWPAAQELPNDSG